MDIFREINNEVNKKDLMRDSEILTNSLNETNEEIEKLNKMLKKSEMSKSLPTKSTHTKQQKSRRKLLSIEPNLMRQNRTLTTSLKETVKEKEKLEKQLFNTKKENNPLFKSLPELNHDITQYFIFSSLKKDNSDERDQKLENELFSKSMSACQNKKPMTPFEINKMVVIQLEDVDLKKENDKLKQENKNFQEMGKEIEFLTPEEFKQPEQK